MLATSTWSVIDLQVKARTLHHLNNLHRGRKKKIHSGEMNSSCISSSDDPRPIPATPRHTHCHVYLTALFSCLNYDLQPIYLHVMEIHYPASTRIYACENNTLQNVYFLQRLSGAVGKAVHSRGILEHGDPQRE